MRKRRDKQNPNNKPKIVKTIPLAIAVAAISSGAAFAANVDEIKVTDSAGNTYTIDMARYNTEDQYKTDMKAFLKAQFKGYSSEIIVHDQDTNMYANLNKMDVNTTVDDLWNPYS